MRKAYSSGPARKQFEIIRPLFETKKSAKPPGLDLYEVFCAMLCVLKTGATWRVLPDSLPNWNATCRHFRSWPEKGESGKSAIDNAPGGLMPGERAANGRKGEPPMIIAGSRSAENADAAEIKGHDGGKLISGAEIHIAAGALGPPSAPRRRMLQAAAARCS
jgi:hypothetical protein